MRRNKLVCCITALVFGLALSPASHALSDPSAELLARIFQVPDSPRAPQPLVCGWYCESIIDYTTATATGSGSSCTAAQSNLTSQVQSLANTTCMNNTGMTYCNLQVFTTAACTEVSPGVFQVQGYARHRCRETTC